MQLHPIEKRTGLTRKEFQEEYLKKNKPVVFTDLSANWAAREKWTFDFFKSNYGHLEAPVFSTKDSSQTGKFYMKAKRTMPFKDYLEIIEHEPTDFRLFLFNIFKHAPELISDFSMPNVMDGWLTGFPMTFFGGQDSYVNLHYDIDCSAVFLTQFQSRRKRVILFAPDQSAYLYQHPFTVQAHVNVLDPDYEKYPAFELAQGFETTIQDGETVFIPPLFWHYIYYTDGGYSLSIRANDRVATRVRGAWNIARHNVVDKGLNRLLGDQWRSFKVHTAAKRATKALENAK